jgi:hypothetical protein
MPVPYHDDKGAVKVVATIATIFPLPGLGRSVDQSCGLFRL